MDASLGTVDSDPPTTVLPLVEKTIRHAQCGDPVAFATIVHRHGDSIRRLVRAIVGREREDDVTQEVLLRVFRQLRRFDPSRADSLRAWLLVLTRNVCLDVRKARRLPTVSLEELVENSPSSPVSPLDELLRRETGDAITRELNQLPPRYRQVFRQRELENRSVEEVARLTRVTRANVCARLSRAKKQLRVRLAGLAPTRSGSATSRRAS